MLSRIIVMLVLISMPMTVLAQAIPDSTIVEGDLRITGTPEVNGLVFPDSSKQYKAAATSLVTQTVYSIPDQQVSFPSGQASPAIQTCVQCPQGMVATGGGGKQTAGGVGFLLLNGSYPAPDPTSWCVSWVASLPSPQSQTCNVQTWATCLKTSLP
jgi:hypothetical protein